MHAVAARDVQAPHVQVHRLLHARVLEQTLVVGVMPRAQDDRTVLVTGDEQPDLIVGREVRRTDHAITTPLAQPPPGRVKQSARRLGIVLALKPPEQAPVVVLELVEVVIDVGTDPSHRPSVAVGQEVLGAGVLEPGVLALIEPFLQVHQQRRHPARLPPIQPPRQPYERAQPPSVTHRPDLQRHRHHTLHAQTPPPPSALFLSMLQVRQIVSYVTCSDGFVLLVSWESRV